ncbi:hypothetical protein QOZ80_5BG0419320 [Eleusine coracana subsp. coracana]|nr:hypothetical protein QOZ80_5BG0419320 [Eleusine coracana subsp. coracana]
MATGRQTQFRLPDATLHPPALSPDDDDAEIPWVLLDQRAYVADCTNATTAASTTWDNKPIQVTFCIARPPRVSYFCVFCPGLDHTEFPLEPRILAMEQDLVLLSVIVSSKSDVCQDRDYYIYKAADRSAGGRPSLKRLPRPPEPHVFSSTNVGILRCGTSHLNMAMRRHGDIVDDDFYVVAGLCKARNLNPEKFILCHYNSKVATHWSTDNICVSLSEQHIIQHGRFFHHGNTKVISIGGDGGTMGFVDLWRGIIFCDVLKFVKGRKSIAPLSFVALPSALRPDSVPSGDPRLCRDIAVIEGEEGRMIKYVDLEVQWKPGQGFQDSYAINGWVSRAWKMPVSSTYMEDKWVPDCRCESSRFFVDKNPHFELLPKVLDGEGRPLPAFKELDIRQPTLSLNDDDDGIVYFMIKKNPGDAKAWVIAVDMRDNTLQGASEFAAERTVHVTFAYMHSRISKYLRKAPGTKGSLKRHGMVLLGSSSKRRLGMSMLDWEIARPTDAEMEAFGMELD